MHNIGNHLLCHVEGALGPKISAAQQDERILVSAIIDNFRSKELKTIVDLGTPKQFVKQGSGCLL